MKEIELADGMITPGVVRIGDTVRRPRNERSDWINQLLTSLEDVGYRHAPRFRADREMLLRHRTEFTDTLDQARD